MGRAKARLLVSDLLALVKHYKALALEVGSREGSDVAAFQILKDSPHFSDSTTQTLDACFVEQGCQTSFNKLRYVVGVRDDSFESKVALFNDAYELTGWQQRSISLFNFNEGEVVPFMNEAVYRHRIANPVVFLPVNWSSSSGDAAQSYDPKPKPKPYVPPHNRGGGRSGNKKVLTKFVERQHHHHHHHSGQHAGKHGHGRRARNKRATGSGGASKGTSDNFTRASPSPSSAVVHSEEPYDYARESLPSSHSSSDSGGAAAAGSFSLAGSSQSVSGWRQFSKRAIGRLN
ncbi:hypothetical protein CYMTET_31677 [Cymbomonas tetramitiformis]|uniref:Uncharacterized protein n=1 Tax=Cymbomonas tetramitiformis TaxID=36881 RepID=A0AAE0FGC8_9CHLO|nr:hypothetical protein CYMTET_31677 [Cymbomonas tetramitiformis]